VIPDDRLLIGLDRRDDAAVYALGGGQALVATLDFFTPLLDDPRDFGAVAAANALSDLYAMHARPLFALNILGVPVGRLGPEIIGAILAGAAEVCAEAGIPIAGGHSIDDPEPKFGLVALGLADPEDLWRKGGGAAGDSLVLGKAIGTGIVTTALKRGQVDDATLAVTVASMRRLNRDAAVVLEGCDVQGVTDVTGYGLLGHLWEMCRASGLDARLRASAPAVLPGAIELAMAGCVPGGTGRNRHATDRHVRWSDDIDDVTRELLYDPQTSGGLLAAVSPRNVDRAVEGLLAAGYEATVIGVLETAGGDVPTIAIDP